MVALKALSLPLRLAEFQAGLILDWPGQRLQGHVHGLNLLLSTSCLSFFPPFMPLIKGVIFSSPHPLPPPLPSPAEVKTNPSLLPGQSLALHPGEKRSMVTDAAGGRHGVGQARHLSLSLTNTDHYWKSTHSLRGLGAGQQPPERAVAASRPVLVRVPSLCRPSGGAPRFPPRTRGQRQGRNGPPRAALRSRRSAEALTLQGSPRP